MNSYSSLPFQIIKRTDNSLYSVRFSTEDILKINDLYFSKDCGHEETRMLRICGSSICTPLQIIYKSCLDRRKLPQGWKKTKVVPVHRKNDKQLLKNYHLFSLLLICGKTFERTLYNSLFNLPNQNDVISLVRPGFKPVHSCINQLLSIIHEKYHSMVKVMKFEVYFLVYRKLNQSLILTEKF